MKQLYEEQETINQLNNNKMIRKTNKKEEQVETVPETREDALRRLFKENGLVKEDVYKDKRGFVIITRSGIDKIVSKKGITVAYEPVVMDLDKTDVVLKAFEAETKVVTDSPLLIFPSLLILSASITILVSAYFAKNLSTNPHSGFSSDIVPFPKSI